VFVLRDPLGELRGPPHHGVQHAALRHRRDELADRRLIVVATDIQIDRYS
jgi:hypothetical protein